MTEPKKLLKDCTPAEVEERYRRAVAQASHVLMPDGRQFMIMWRFYEQFGIRHLETGEQYAIRYDSMKDIIPLTLCPIDLNLV